MGFNSRFKGLMNQYLVKNIWVITWIVLLKIHMLLAVWIYSYAIFLFISAVLISATQIWWPWYLSRVNADLGHWYRLLHSLSVCCLLQLKSKYDPARLHSRPRCGTVAIGEECGHNWSRNFLSYLTVSLNCHGCISL